MNIGNIVSLLIAFSAGVLIGLVYFVTLKFTIEHMVTSKRPALVMLGSYLLRTVFVLLAFYLIMDGELMRLLASLVGFIITRIILVKRFGPHKPLKN